MEEKLVGWTFVVAIISILILIVYSAFSTVMADGSRDYCYVVGVRANAANSMDTFNLMGHRPWNSDAFIGNYSNLPAAIEAANSIGCYIR